MGLFSRKKTAVQDEAKKKTAVKPDKASDDKKEVKPAEKASMKELYGKSEEVSHGKKSGKKELKYGDGYRILAKPLVTEKVSNLGVINKYVFEVSGKANKIEIAKAINEVYGVKPVKVGVINMSGRQVGYGRIRGRRKAWKKAVVTLPPGESIKVYEGV